MHRKKDEDILYDCYLRLAHNCKLKKSKVNRSKDKELMNSIRANYSMTLYRLTSDIPVPNNEIKKAVLKAKNVYYQYYLVKNRNPEFTDPGLEKSLDQMIRAACVHEAEMLGCIRAREAGGERIDIKSIFDHKNNLNMLAHELAGKIVSGFLTGKESVPVLYITETGKKYHRTEYCPYCRGKNLYGTTRAMADNQKLTPCKCVTSFPADMVDHNHVTAFVDESIRKVMWNNKGTSGKTGSYSYIICWGQLESEEDITENNIIKQGVDYTGEQDHIEMITETAIGKVLLSLVYDLEFEGRVHIYTDNMTAAAHWQSDALNSKLSKHFQSVIVSYVPREKNKKADKLCRTRVFLNMPGSCYDELVMKVNNIRNLENKIRQMETQQNKVKWVPEVILGGQVI